MDTAVPFDTRSSSANPDHELCVGDMVVYGLHGKCTITAVETRIIEKESILFFRLEKVKSSFSRGDHSGLCLYVPVKQAQSRGLRKIATSAGAQAALETLASKEYFFTMDQPWKTTLSQLESSMIHEGLVGLAKAYSFLFVYCQRLSVPPREAKKLEEVVKKNLFRELSETLLEPTRIIEDRVQRHLRQKLLLDH